MTIQQVADAINAKSKGPVVAAVVKDGSNQDRLVLSSRTTGSTSDFTVTGGLTSEDLSFATPDLSKLDAEYSLDGAAPVASKTNVLDNIIPGLRITLKGPTTSAATITTTEPALDRDAVKAKVKTFVDAYNAFVDAARAEITEKPIANPASSFQAAQGQLYGDIGLNSMLSSLRQQMTKIVTAAGVNDLGDLGVVVPKPSAGGTVSDDAKAGKLTIDDAKLTAALEADATAVKDFFASFSKDVGDYVDKQSGSSGVIDGRLKSADSDLRSLQDQLTRANERIDAKEKRLKAQFAAMESALQNSQTQQAWLTGQLAALNK
jgi:flagellar hook-associated protein 2